MTGSPARERAEAPSATTAATPAPVSSSRPRPPAAVRGAKRTILVNAASIVGTYGVTSALGAVFWWLAAHRFAPAEVGRASAVISAMMLLAGLSSLGLNTFLLGELRRQRDPGRILGSAFAGTGLAGAGLGFAYVLVTPRVVSDLEPLAASPASIGVFVAGVVAIAIGNALDGGLTALLKAQMRLLRNMLLGLSKLAVLVLLAVAVARPSSVAIYGAWTLGAYVALIVPALGIRRWTDGLSLRRLRPAWRTMWSFRRAVGEHQVVNLGLTVPSLVLPSLVIGLLSAEANASFYVAWMVASIVFIVPPALTQILFAVSPDPSATLGEEARMTMRLSVATGALAIAVVGVAATPILALFGSAYADSGSWVLRILILAALPLSVKDHYVALMRIRRRLRRALPLIWAGTAAELGFAAAGARLHGLEGLSVGWLSAVAIEAALMARPVHGMLLREGPPRRTPGRVGRVGRGPAR